MDTVRELLHYSLNESEVSMLIFLAIMIAGLVILIGGSLFSHDHDGEHPDHGSGHDNEATVSIFSTKMVGTFIMGFGGGGAIAQYAWGELVRSSFTGLGVGVLMAAFMYLVMRLMYGQQSTSLVETSSIVGRTGTVTTAIGSRAVGQVVVAVGDQTFTYLARSPGEKEIAKGKTVKVVATSGSDIVVDLV
jgi:membrane protein implicated in regulation of membrane protease activity